MTQKMMRMPLTRPALVMLATALASVAYVNMTFMSGRDLLVVRASSALEVNLRAFRNTTETTSHQVATATEQITLPSLSPIDGNVSACLLLKDDNELLNEWIAYHYHTMRMRHLLVAVDPSSRTSPESIFAKWRNMTDLKIDTWNDADFMPDSFIETGYFIQPGRVAADSNRSRWLRIPTCNKVDCTVTRDDKVRIANHRFRQVTFLSKCFSYHRDEGRTLVMHIDTDEYVVLNHHKRKGELRGIPVPSLVQPDALYRYLRAMYQDDFLYSKINMPCLSMPRVLFGAVEDAASVKQLKGLSGDYNRRRFETMRWWYHTLDDDKERNGQPKVIVDVAQVPADDEMFTKLFSIHRPSKMLCRTLAQINFDEYQRYPLTVAHYLGPWDRYNARNDSRRTSDLFQYKSNVHEGPDYFMLPWLQGFITSVGTDKAHVLLADYLTEAAKLKTNWKVWDAAAIK